MWPKTLKKCLIITIASIMLIAILALPTSTSATSSNNIEVSYSSHVQTYGWLAYSPDITGTEGESKRMEALDLNVKTPAGVTVKYRAHVQGIGWQDWVTADNTKGTNLIGTSGESKRVEAIQIVVEGSSDYVIRYRTQVQTYGWLDWVEAGNSIKEAETLKAGTYAGTSGESKRMEAMQISIIPKEQSKTEEAKKEEQVLEQVQVQAEVQKQAEAQKQEEQAKQALAQAVEQKKEEAKKEENKNQQNNVHVHTFSDWVTTVKPTCVSTGTQTRQCIDCKYTETKQIPGDPNAHMLINAPELDKDSTCEAEGRKNTKYCALCHQEFFSLIKAKGHIWANSETTTPATCTTPGVTSIRCTREGCNADKNVKMIPATGHSFGNWYSIKKATCMEEGSIERKCNKCDARQTQTTSKVDHVYSSEWTVDIEPTGDKLGEESRHCTTPGCTARTSIRSVAHKHTFNGQGTIITPATCLNWGLERRICTTCGKTVDYAISPKGQHNLGPEQTSYKGNDCIGSFVYRECKDCGEKVWEEGERAGLGHNWTTNNMETAKCTRCGIQINWTNAWAAEHDATAPGFDDGWKFDNKGEMRVRRVWWVQFRADTTRSVGFNGKTVYAPNTVITADYVYQADAPEARSGYKFVGWFNASDKDNSNPITTSKHIDANWKYAHMVLEARYEVK